MAIKVYLSQALMAVNNTHRPEPGTDGNLGSGVDLHSALLQVAKQHIRLLATQQRMVAGQVIQPARRHEMNAIGLPVPRISGTAT